MLPRTLYVIGNGFDLWHGIPSRYSDFRKYLESADSQVFRAVEDYIPANENWSDLEGALADLDVDHIVDSLSHFMGSYGDDDWSDAGHHDFQYEVELVVQRLSRELRSRFADWIRTLVIPTPQTAAQRLRSLDPGGLFLSFNYTSTLRSLYQVPDDRVLFIHGCAVRGDDLILGHAWSPESRTPLTDVSDPEDVDTRLMEAYDLIDDYFPETFKPSKALIQANQAFFDSLRHIDHVVVLGHGLADVDAVYFHALLGQESVRRAQWLDACRNSDDAHGRRARIAELGVNPSHIHCALWEAIPCSRRRRRA